MVFFNQTLNHFFALLLIFFAFLLLISFSSSPASCNEIHPKINTADPSHRQPPSAYQVLRIKNTTPFLLNKPERGFEKKRKRKMTKRRKINMDSNFKTRPFTVMLPKGFVPPSGSSPCHNDKPDSAVAQDLICGLSGATAKP
ncbi:Alpha-mannosidase 3 isoform 1 [Hibiscus syriacus]|uniref:Alpha-mannosidase 3 isoform 1 n=1 Tax=Hibiscus syriacus TaxID=106335 RepID=A0A6A2XAG3_HIBSY|nr:uncharacterized protein LOC120196368 [Hibiscus syriacus]KAE8655329.1 Alpha-mannosidase 3 isoform 1 [Hibiscus syriacus]